MSLYSLQNKQINKNDLQWYYQHLAKMLQGVKMFDVFLFILILK